MIRVLYFASLRDKIGQEEEELDYSGTVAGLMGLLCNRGAAWSDVFADNQSVLSAVNQEMAKPESEVSDGDEVGFFPPVTGG